MTPQGGSSPDNQTVPVTDPNVTPATKKGAPSLAQIWKESVADSRKLLESTAEEEAQNPGNARQVVDGSLIGTCLVFFAAMLGVKQLDPPLTVASVAFASAIPPLACGFLFASYKITEKIQRIPGWRLLGAFLVGGWIIEGVGLLAVLVGVFCVILHVSQSAAVAFRWATIVTVILLFIGSPIGLMIYAVVHYQRHQGQAKPEAQPALSPAQPPAEPAPQAAPAPAGQAHRARKRQKKTAPTSAGTAQQP